MATVNTIIDISIGRGLPGIAPPVPVENWKIKSSIILRYSYPNQKCH